MKSGVSCYNTRVLVVADKGGAGSQHGTRPPRGKNLGDVVLVLFWGFFPPYYHHSLIWQPSMLVP